MSNPVEDFNEFQRIVSSNGFKAYRAELERLIDIKNKEMDNDTASAELLKNYQLIRKGLKMALSIPNTLEVRAKANKPEGGM